jgi:hypothetical protein
MNAKPAKAATTEWIRKRAGNSRPANKAAILMAADAATNPNPLSYDHCDCKDYRRGYLHVDQVAGFRHCLHGFRRHRYDFLAHEQHSVLRQYWDITQPLVHSAFGRAWPVRTAWTPGTMQALTVRAFIFPYPFVLFTGGVGRAMVEPWRCGKGYLIAGDYYAHRASECGLESPAF